MEEQQLQEKWFRKHVRVEVEVDKLSSNYGEYGIATKIDAKEKQLSIITDKIGLTLPISACSIRTERECHFRAFLQLCQSWRSEAHTHAPSAWVLGALSSSTN